MKTPIMILLILAGLCLPSTKQSPELYLLNEKANFHVDIFNDVLKYSVTSSDVIMLRIVKTGQKANNDTASFELRVAMLNRGIFKYFYFSKDKYFGFFNYQNHLVLVYGDDSAKYFFSKTNTKKRCDFIPETRYIIDKDHPPIPIEPQVFLYSYKDGQYKLIDTGMLGAFD